MAPRLNYSTEVGQARAHQIVMAKRQEFPTSNEMGCWLFTGSRNNDGYGQVSLTSYLWLALTCTNKCYRSSPKRTPI